MVPEVAVGIPEMVELAEKWSRELGYATERTEGRRTDGSVIPSIAIEHGAVSLLCNEQNGALHVLAVMNIAPETRANLRRLDVAQNAQFLSTLKSVLMQNPRGGFSVYPGGFRHAAEMQQISLDQRLRIAPGDLASYNRFIDALQEVSVGALRLAAVFEPYFANP